MSGPSPVSRREPSRSRFRVLALAAFALLATGCSNQFGYGITALPADGGWQPLPIGHWVLNDGHEVKAMSFCPRQSCPRQGFAALVALEGRDADAMERQLERDPARLARDFAKPPAPARTRSGTATKPRPSPARPKSSTLVTRYAEGGTNGLLVEIRALGESGKRAFTAVLSGREGGRLAIAIGVSTEAEAAKSQALAAWKDR